MVGALLAVSVGSADLSMTAPWQLVLLWGVVVGLGSGAIRCRSPPRSPTAGSSAARPRHRRPDRRERDRPADLPAALAWIVAGFGWRSPPSRSPPSRGSSCRWWRPDARPARGRRAEPLRRRRRRSDRRRAAPVRGGVTGRSTRAARARFWLLAGSFFICGATTNGLIGTHLIPAHMDHGIPEVAAASLLALIGVFDIVGTTGSGWLTDRYDPRRCSSGTTACAGSPCWPCRTLFGSAHFGLSSSSSSTASTGSRPSRRPLR